jgi:hypothetical protein
LWRAPGLVEYEDLVFLWKIRDLGAIVLLLATFFITGTPTTVPAAAAAAAAANVGPATLFVDAVVDMS